MNGRNPSYHQQGGWPDPNGRPTYPVSPTSPAPYPARSPPPYSAIGVGQVAVSPEQSVDPRFVYMQQGGQGVRDGGGQQGYAAPSINDPRIQPRNVSVSQPVANADREGLKRKHPPDHPPQSTNPPPTITSAQQRPGSSDGRAEKRLKQESVEPRTPMSADAQTKINGVMNVGGTSARLLCIADIRGDFKRLNELIREHKATAVIHTGEFGFLEARSPSRIKPGVLRHAISYCPLITDPIRYHLLNLQHGPELFFALQSDHTNPSFKLSQLPSLISGEIELAAPVYTLYGGMDDPRVIDSFKNGEYQAKNLKILDQGSSKLIDCGEMSVRLFGIGLNIHTQDSYDPIDGSGGIVGKDDRVRSTAIQIGTLVNTAEKYYDPREVRILIVNGPLARDGLAAMMAVSLKVDYIISGANHLGVIRSFNELSVQSDPAAYRNALEKTQASFAGVFEAAKAQFGNMPPDEEVQLRNAMMVLYKMPDSGSGSAEAYEEDQTWKNCWIYDLCPASYGFLILQARGWRMYPTTYSAGRSFEYRKALVPPERPQPRVASNAPQMAPPGQADQGLGQDRVVAQDFASSGAVQPQQQPQQVQQQVPQQPVQQQRQQQEPLQQRPQQVSQQPQQEAERQPRQPTRLRDDPNAFGHPEAQSRNMPPSADPTQARTQDRRTVAFEANVTSVTGPTSDSASVVIAPTEPLMAGRPQEFQRPAQIAIPPSQHNAGSRRPSQATPHEYPAAVKPESASPSPYEPRDPSSASQYTMQSQQYAMPPSMPSSMGPPSSSNTQASRPASSNQLSMYAPLERQLMTHDSGNSNWSTVDAYGMPVGQMMAQQAYPPQAHDAWLFEQPSAAYQPYEQHVIDNRHPVQQQYIQAYESRAPADNRSHATAQSTQPTQTVQPTQQRQPTSAPAARPASQQPPQAEDPRIQQLQPAASGPSQKQGQQATQKPSQASARQPQRQTQVQQSQQQRATQSSQTNTQPPTQTSTKPQAAQARSTAQPQVNGTLNASTASSTAQRPTSATTDQRLAATTSNPTSQNAERPTTASQPATTASRNAASRPPGNNTSAPSGNETSGRSPPNGSSNNASSSALSSRPAWITADEPASRPRSPVQAPASDNQPPRKTLSDRLSGGQPPNSRPSAADRASSSTSVPRNPSQAESSSSAGVPSLAERIAPPEGPDHRRLWIRGLPHPCNENDLMTIWSASIQDKITSIQIPRATRGNHKGIAYVAFRTPEDADDALRHHDNTLNGAPLRLQLSDYPLKPYRENPPPARNDYREDYREDPDRNYRPRSPDYYPPRGRGRGRGTSRR